MFKPKQLHIGHAKECFNYLHDHFRYHTLNSWNRLQSIANNVKVYKLKTKNSTSDILDCLDECYDVVNTFLTDWELDHPGYVLGFNGRSGGYLVIYNDSDNGNILPDKITDSDDYDEFKRWIHEEGYTVKEYMPTLREYTLLVRDFDIFCDKLAAAVDNLTTEYLQSKK